MSAFIVRLATIDALVTAGLRHPSRKLRWLWLPVEEDKSEAFRRGSWCGPESDALYERKVHELTHQTASAVGQMLLAQNYVSVNHRYDETSEPPEYEWRRYTHLRESGHRVELKPVEVLHLLDGYEYQACEDPGWETCQAFAFCDALRRHLIQDLPGYDEGPWDLDERTPLDQGPRPLSELMRRRF